MFLRIEGSKREHQANNTAKQLILFSFWLQVVVDTDTNQHVDEWCTGSLPPH